MSSVAVRALFVGVLLSSSGSLAAAASETVAFNSGSKVLHGRLYKPAGAGPFHAILYNHGSAPGLLNDQAFDLIGRLFVAREWVFFAPYRRGQGLSSDAGPYIQDQIRAAQNSGGEALAAGRHPRNIRDGRSRPEAAVQPRSPFLPKADSHGSSISARDKPVV